MGAPDVPFIDPARDAEALRERRLTVEGAVPTCRTPPGASGPCYAAFVRHAKGAVERSGGYVIRDRGSQGTTACDVVIDQDE